jgi:CHAD domain-containing protein
MAYCLPLRDPLDESFRKIGLEQINLALKELRSRSVASMQIHQSRKAFKRFRALLHLLRPGMRKSTFRRLEDQIRTIAAAFGDARDNQVMIETVAKLEAAAPARACTLVFPALKASLHERLQETAGISPKLLRSQAKALERLATDFKSARLDITDFACFEPGLRRVYADCRERLNRAVTTNDEEDFHDCRKAVQRHWRHMQLLRRIWPEAMRARIELAHDLAQLLGEDHDVAVLKRHVIAEADAIAAKTPRDAFLNFCESHQQMLRARAKLLSERLLCQKPGDFCRLMAVYWRTARDMLELDGRLGLFLKGPNVVRIA